MNCPPFFLLLRARKGKPVLGARLAGTIVTTRIYGESRGRRSRTRQLPYDLGVQRR